jgi:pheromone a factor receptor
MLSGMDPFLTIGYNAWILMMWLPVFPWQNWTATHAGFSHVDKFPAAIWRASQKILILNELSRWICVINAITFFMFFGMTAEARRHYALVLQFVAKKLGCHTGQSDSSEYVAGLKFQLIQKILQTDPSSILLTQT